MNLKDALDMAKKAKLCTIDKNMWAISEVAEGQYICAQLMHFAELVEQETLERAANKADSVGHHWSGAPARTFFELADEIRALKT